jgi:hypothetical protein
MAPLQEQNFGLESYQEADRAAALLVAKAEAAARRAVSKARCHPGPGSRTKCPSVFLSTDICNGPLHRVRRLSETGPMG